MECHKVGLMPHWSEFSTVVSSVAALEKKKKNEELQIMIFFTVHTGINAVLAQLGHIMPAALRIETARMKASLNPDYSFAAESPVMKRARERWQVSVREDEPGPAEYREDEEKIVVRL